MTFYIHTRGCCQDACSLQGLLEDLDHATLKACKATLGAMVGDASRADLAAGATNRLFLGGASNQCQPYPQAHQGYTTSFFIIIFIIILFITSCPLRIVSALTRRRCATRWSKASARSRRPRCTSSAHRQPRNPGTHTQGRHAHSRTHGGHAG